MTNDGLMIGGRSAEDLLIESRELVNRVIAAIAPTNPAHHGTGDASVAADIRWSVERNIRLAAEVLAGRSPGAADELLHASAVRRVEEGASFESILRAYHVGIAVVWEHLASHAAKGDEQALRECTRRLLGHMSAATTPLAAAFQEGLAQDGAHETDVRFALYTALTLGQDPRAVAQRAGRALTARYGVLALQLNHPHVDASVPARVIDRRTTHRLRTAFEAVAPVPEDVLSVVGPWGGTALIPFSDEQEADLVTRLRAALEDRFDAYRAGIAFAAVADIPEALKLAEELREIAAATGSAGVVRLEDVMLEYQATRPGPARSALAAALEPLNEVLLDTVHTYVVAGGDRRTTAKMLNVHPNTVDYRLGRVRTTTGHDPASPAGLAVLQLAAAAARAERASLPGTQSHAAHPPSSPAL